jgi:hypothetical protein
MEAWKVRRLVLLLLVALSYVALMRDCHAWGRYEADWEATRNYQIEVVVCDNPGASVCLEDWVVVRKIRKWHRLVLNWRFATPTRWMVENDYRPPEGSWLALRARDVRTKQITSWSWCDNVEGQPCSVEGGGLTCYGTPEGQGPIDPNGPVEVPCWD